MGVIKSLNGIPTSIISKINGIDLADIDKWNGIQFAKSWADWDEASQETLHPDQDGDGTEDTFIVMFDDPDAGDDETGQGGGLSGSDLVLTENGSIAGATGTPPCRAFDGSGDYFSLTDNACDVLASNEHTIIIKLKLGGDVSGTGDMVLEFSGGSGNEFNFVIATNEQPRIYDVATNSGWDTWEWLGSATLAYDGTVYYIVFACDGTNEPWYGLYTSKPTTKAGYVTGGYEDAANTCSWGGSNFQSTTKRVIGDSSNGFYGSLYYVIFSNHYFF